MVFETLTGIFNRLGIRKNVRNTVGMACMPCQADRERADKAYTQKITGEERSFRERQRERVLCPECGEEIEKGSLVAHCQTQHGVTKGGLGQVGNKEARGANPRTYRMVIPAKIGPMNCPVKGCSDQAEKRTAMRVNLCHHHVWDTVVILEERNLPHPR